MVRAVAKALPSEPLSRTRALDEGRAAMVSEQDIDEAARAARPACHPAG